MNFGRRTETDAALDHRLPNAAAESMNTRVRLIARSAFGFHDPRALIALAFLALGCDRLPPARR